MSSIFFRELGIPEPDINLGVGSGSHARQTAQIMIGLEKVMVDSRPDCVLVYGDTNSTLAGALAACKLRLTLAHVESGLRSFNRDMPEEHNRVLTDHCADLLFCPTQTAVDHLAREAVQGTTHLVGDTMYDAVLQFGKVAAARSNIMRELGLEQRRFLLATVHRPYNTDAPENLEEILSAFIELGETVVFPVHPRTRKRIAEMNGTFDRLQRSRCVKMIEPLGYLDMLALEQSARMILTDSGGIQKEAYFFGVPCVTLRPETEWVETVEAGWNVLVEPRQLRAAVESTPPSGDRPALFGSGDAAARIADVLENA
jgi:UDP-N-acetylglucosamine 2-epimerase